jgi:hypothetical protein
LGFFPFDSVNAVKAVLRAVQDMKASIRFFYKDKLTLNAYKIDTNNIFIGGSSAGAVTALHTVYLNKSCEINPYVAPSTLASLGGMNGYSGNQCYSSKVKGVINLCGGIGNYGWIEAGDLPFCSMHGTIDGTVNYSRGKAISLVYLDGSRMLKQQANVLGISNPFYTWYGQDHVPYASSTQYMDTTISFVRDYLISRLGCTNPPLLLQNTPSGTATLTAYTGCTTNIVPSCAVGIFESSNGIISFDIFPNPSNSDVTISFENQNTNYKIEIFDLSGKLIISTITNQNTYHVYKNTLNSGVYFIKITDSEGKYSVKKLLLN